MNISRQRKRAKCIQACASMRGGECNCSAKQLRLGHMQPGDRVIVDFEGTRLEVIAGSDMHWNQRVKCNGCIPERASNMTRLHGEIGPCLILPSMTPVVKVLHEFATRVRS